MFRPAGLIFTHSHHQSVSVTTAYVKRAFKYRFCPTDEQAAELSRRSAEYTTSGPRFRDGRLTRAKMREPLDIRWSRPLPEGAQPSMVTVSRDPAGRWFVSLLCEDASVRPPPARDTAVGVDVGLDHLLTLSTGEKIANPRHERMDRARLALAQRRMAKKAKGSAGRARARRWPGSMPGSPTVAVTGCTS